MVENFRSRAVDISNVTNSRRTEQATKLVFDTCIYSTGWLKTRLFSRHNFAACVTAYRCFTAKHYLVLIKVMIPFVLYKW